MRTVFYITFLSFFNALPVMGAVAEGSPLLCNWKPVIALPERMKVFGLIFDRGQLEMLGIDAEGEVRASNLGAYNKDANYLSWEGAPLFGKNTLNRETLRSVEGGMQCESTQSPAALESRLKELGEGFTN